MDHDVIADVDPRTGRLEIISKARAQIGEAFERAAEAAGLGHRGITPYGARHTFASLLVQDNVPLSASTGGGAASSPGVDGQYGPAAMKTPGTELRPSRPPEKL